MILTHQIKNYLFLDLLITAATKPGQFFIELKSPGKATMRIPYELKPRSKQNGVTRIKGVNTSDFIYLIMPDRFSNGDLTNDIVKEYQILLNELQEHNPELLDKNRILAISKSDMLDLELQKEIQKEIAPQECIFISMKL